VEPEFGDQADHNITKATVIQHKKKTAESDNCTKATRITHQPYHQTVIVQHNSFLTFCYFQGYLLYGYGGKKLYEYSVFKPLEGYFKWPSNPLMATSSDLRDPWGWTGSPPDFQKQVGWWNWLEGYFEWLPLGSVCLEDSSKNLIVEIGRCWCGKEGHLLVWSSFFFTNNLSHGHDFPKAKIKAWYDSGLHITSHFWNEMICSVIHRLEKYKLIRFWTTLTFSYQM